MDFVVFLCMRTVICKHSCLNLGNAEIHIKQGMGVYIICSTFIIVLGVECSFYVKSIAI